MEKLGGQILHAEQGRRRLSSGIVLENLWQVSNSQFIPVLSHTWIELQVQNAGWINWFLFFEAHIPGARIGNKDTIVHFQIGLGTRAKLAAFPSAWDAYIIASVSRILSMEYLTQQSVIQTNSRHTIILSSSSMLGLDSSCLIPGAGLARSGQLQCECTSEKLCWEVSLRIPTLICCVWMLLWTNETFWGKMATEAEFLTSSSGLAMSRVCTMCVRDQEDNLNVTLLCTTSINLISYILRKTPPCDIKLW